MKRKIRKVLIELGVPVSLDGFEYMAEAIGCITETSKKKIGMIYVFVADKFNSTDRRVERCIRTAITKMNRDSEAWKKYVGVDIHKNAEVVYTLAYKIREELEDEQDISARDSWRVRV